MQQTISKWLTIHQSTQNRTFFTTPCKDDTKNLSECFAVFLYVYSIRAAVLFVLPSLFSEDRTSDGNVLDECCTKEQTYRISVP
ncbi:MAG: hypothetical protein MJZ93_01225 [Paludibacteraceae bacterium]|nr:hypothetical protein [Paludibacteraceae bacterium]